MLAPIALIAETAVVLVVHPSLEVKSVADLIAMAKAKPGEVLYATAGKGTATHLAAELFSVSAGVKMTPVHYKGGGETLKDLLSGQVKVMFSTIPPVLGFVKEGQLRGIATTGPKRDKVLPDLPTVAESGLAGYDMRLWFGLAAPAPHRARHRPPGGGPQAGARHAGRAIGLCEARLRAFAGHAGGVRRLLRQRSRQMEKNHRRRRVDRRFRA